MLKAIEIQMSEYGQLVLRHEITVGEDIPEEAIIKIFGSLKKFRAEIEEDKKAVISAERAAKLLEEKEAKPKRPILKLPKVDYTIEKTTAILTISDWFVEY